MANEGSLKNLKIKIGGQDIASNFQDASFAGFNIYENIMNPTGPLAEIRLVDFEDFLGKNNLNGAYDKDIEIEFDGENGGRKKFKLKMYENKNLNNRSYNNLGSGHCKEYDLRCVSPELLNCQGNYIQKSFNGKTSDVVKHIVEKGFKSDKKFNGSQTKGNRRIIINNKHPLDAYHDMNNEHVSDKYESSCFVLFQKEDEYHFKTFEELFEGQSKGKFTHSTTWDYESGGGDKNKAVLWFKPSRSFLTSTRSLSKPAEYTFNLTTHKVAAVDPESQDNFKTTEKSKVYQGQLQSAKEVPVKYIHDKANNKDKHETSTAKTKRAAFLSHLAQNSAELEIPFNDINIGDIIELDIPEMSTDSNGDGEKQFNGKCCVVGIRTKYKGPGGQPPDCTQVLRVVMASYKRGGGQA
jgi:hypothetical protein